MFLGGIIAYNYFYYYYYYFVWVWSFSKKLKIERKFEEEKDKKKFEKWIKLDYSWLDWCGGAVCSSLASIDGLLQMCCLLITDIVQHNGHNVDAHAPVLHVLVY